MSAIQYALIVIPPLVLSVILHEIAHGWVAGKLGDPTATRLGRLTLNPIPHIDPVMTVLLPALLVMAHSPVVFGGAKPVPVDPRYFQNPKRDMMLVAVAGPATNFLLAAICYALFLMISGFKVAPGAFGSPIVLIGYWLVYGMLINVVLAVFNLIPVPPLDGGRIAVGLLPHRWAYKVARLEPYGFLIVIGLLYIGAFDLVLHPFLSLVGHLLSP